MNSLVEELISRKRLVTPNIIAAFKRVPRINFMLPEYKNLSEVDAAFPIGFGQTISQPSTVAFMLELLAPRKGNKILDIGFGSGWTTALLAELVGKKGKIWAIEIVPEVFEFGKANVKRLGFSNVEFILGDGSKGLAQNAPFDRILGGASAPKTPQPLKEQLKIGGRLVFPVRDTVVLLTKKGKNDFQETVYPFFAFVPLKGEYGY